MSLALNAWMSLMLPYLFENLKGIGAALSAKTIGSEVAQVDLASDSWAAQIDSHIKNKFKSFCSVVRKTMRSKRQHCPCMSHRRRWPIV